VPGCLHVIQVSDVRAMTRMIRVGYCAIRHHDTHVTLYIYAFSYIFIYRLFFLITFDSYIYKHFYSYIFIYKQAIYKSSIYKV
jgi:hypothetical protein